MLAFNLPGVDFPDSMSRSREVTLVHPGGIHGEVHQAKRLEEFLPLDKNFIRSTPEHIGQDDPGQR